MESGGDAWPERLRPFQLPCHPPLCDSLTHLPLSLAVDNIHDKTSSAAAMSLLASIQTHTDHEKHFPFRALHTWGGRMAAVWCVIWLVYVLEWCLRPAVEWASVYLISALPWAVTGGDSFIQWEKSCRGMQTCCCNAQLLVECAVSCTHRLDQHLSRPSKSCFGLPWY